MKTLTTMILTGMVLANTAKAAPTPKDTASEIQAQAAITKGHIDNLLESISQTKVDQNFNVTDYLEQTQDFKDKIEAALVTFEDTLEGEILPEASKLMNQYNAIAKSTMYSDDQKKAILTERYKNIQEKFALLTEKYKASIRAVYTLVPLSTQSFNLSVDSEKDKVGEKRSFSNTVKASIKVGTTTFSRKFTVTRESRGDSSSYYTYVKVDKEAPTKEARQYGTKYTYDYFLGMTRMDYAVLDYSAIAYAYVAAPLKAEIYGKLLYPTVKGSCKSTMCVALRASDYTTLMERISKKIDRAIEMRLADGKEVAIKNLDQYIDSDIKELYLNTNYPEKLPFTLD